MPKKMLVTYQEVIHDKKLTKNNRSWILPECIPHPPIRKVMINLYKDIDIFIDKKFSKFNPEKQEKFRIRLENNFQIAKFFLNKEKINLISRIFSRSLPLYHLYNTRESNNHKCLIYRTGKDDHMVELCLLPVPKHPDYHNTTYSICGLFISNEWTSLEPHIDCYEASPAYGNYCVNTGKFLSASELVDAFIVAYPKLDSKLRSKINLNVASLFYYYFYTEPSYLNAIQLAKKLKPHFWHEILDDLLDFLVYHEANLRYYSHHAKVIQRRFHKAINDPNYELCKRRLAREFTQLQESS